MCINCDVTTHCRPVSGSCMCVNCDVLPHMVDRFPGFVCVSVVTTLLTSFWVLYVHHCVLWPHF